MIPVDITEFQEIMLLCQKLHLCCRWHHQPMAVNCCNPARSLMTYLGTMPKLSMRRHGYLSELSSKHSAIILKTQIIQYTCSVTNGYCHQLENRINNVTSTFSCRRTRLIRTPLISHFHLIRHYPINSQLLNAHS